MSPVARLLLVAALATAAAPPAVAEPPDDVKAARAHFKRGVELYDLGRFRDAVAEFEAAYRLKPHGTIHFNVAQCRERLGEWPAALRAYHDYLVEVPDADDRVKVRAAMRRVEDRLAATGVQALLVSSEPPGAEVRIDGRPRGRTPLAIALPPGAYAVTFEQPGFAVATRQVDLTLEAHAVVQVALAPGADTPRVADLSAGSAAAAEPSAASPAPLATAPLPDGPARKPEGGRVWTWVATGAAVLAAGAGAYYGVTAQQKSDALLGSVHPSGEATALEEDAKAASRNANVLYGVAAGAAAAGVTLFFVEGRF
jgi:tetratricopeptide (TPR) repeat protein